MLIRFLYLDRDALAQYVSSVEGGSLREATMRSLKGKTGEVGGTAKVVHGSRGSSSEDEEERTLVDTDAARFRRLLAAAEEDPEALAWVDVVNPDDDLEGIGIGSIVSWECDIWVPQASQMLSQAQGMVATLDRIRTVLPSARALGLNTEGLPADDELEAMSGLVKGMQSSSVLIVGEDDATDWRIAGDIRPEVGMDDLDGRARVVGKVSRVMREGQWKPFLTLPGMNLLSREQRRKAERTPPAPGKEGEYLHGPALLLDVLAVYR